MHTRRASHGSARAFRCAPQSARACLELAVAGVLALRTFVDEHAPALAGLRDDVRHILAPQIAVRDQELRDLLDEREITAAIRISLEDRAARISRSCALGGVERKRRERALQADELIGAAELGLVE